MAESWTRPSVKMPPPGVLVDAISPSGSETRLIVIDGLWFLEDKSMYVYWVPEFWRRV